jgi:hypothetical protein
MDGGVGTSGSATELHAEQRNHFLKSLMVTGVYSRY